MKLINNLSIVPLEDYLVEPRKWDIFITCGSFEKRCMGCSEVFLSKVVDIEVSIVFNYFETNSEKEKNMEVINSSLKSICGSVYSFDSESVSLPREGIIKFTKYIDEMGINLTDKEILIDISVFTKPYLFLLFKVLYEKYHLRQIHVAYTEPEKYKSRNPSLKEIILTDGLDRIESIPGFLGSSIKSNDALIVILGFEGKRSMEIFRNIDPAVVYAINGFPSYKPGWDKISLESNMYFLQESGAIENLFYSPAIDPFETKKLIGKIVEEIKGSDHDYNVIIAPLGTKMQAFGVLLHAITDKTIKVIYPFPSRYKSDRSENYGRTWIFAVKLGEM